MTEVPMIPHRILPVVLASFLVACSDAGTEPAGKGPGLEQNVTVTIAESYFSNQVDSVRTIFAATYDSSVIAVLPPAVLSTKQLTFSLSNYSVRLSSPAPGDSSTLLVLFRNEAEAAVKHWAMLLTRIPFFSSGTGAFEGKVSAAVLPEFGPVTSPSIGVIVSNDTLRVDPALHRLVLGEPIDLDPRPVVPPAATSWEIDIVNTLPTTVVYVLDDGLVRNAVALDPNRGTSMGTSRQPQRLWLLKTTN